MSIAKVGLEPMGMEIAKILRTRILAGYPYLKAHDPEGYKRALEEVLSQYPRWAGERAILKVDEEKPEFPPSDRVLRSWLDEAMRPYRYAQEWQQRSAEQLKERAEIERQQAQKPATEQPPRGKVVTYGEALAMGMTRPIGVFETEHMGAKRTVPYRG